MGKTPCCEKHGVRRGAWTPEEDQALVDYINKHGHGSWRTLPKHAGTLSNFSLHKHFCKCFFISTFCLHKPFFFLGIF
jgi:hypothetical protein